jgi:plastocyanin
MKGSTSRIVLIAAVALACAVLVPILIASRGGDPVPREVRVVVRDMAYYVDGQGAPNPTLQFKAGERIRFVLRNEDGGMTHDFVIRDWKVATKLLDEKGEEDAIEFRVPRRASTAGYQCTPHSQMMRGSVQVN